MSPFGQHSRRTVIGWGTAALALVPGAARAAAPDAPATPPASPDAIQGDSDASHHLTIETHINGKGPFRFVVDTGADQTVISDQVAISLGLITGEEVIVQGISRALQATAVQLRELSFGNVTVNNLRTPILNHTLLDADGYLGLDAIDGRRVIFDFENNKLTVTNSQITPKTLRWKRESQTLVRANGSDGRLTASDCVVDGVRTYAFVDSGAEGSIGNTRLFAELQKKGATFMDDDVIPILGVTGGVALGRETRISSIRLGALQFVDGTLIISDLPVFNVWGLEDKPAMFMGMNFLRKTSSFTIDYGKKELIIQLADMRIVRAT